MVLTISGFVPQKWKIVQEEQAEKRPKGAFILLTSMLSKD